MRHRLAAVLTLGLLSALILGSSAVQAEERKVVFVAGTRSHGYGAHEYHAECLLLSDLLNKHHDGVTSEVFRNGWPDDERVKWLGGNKEPNWTVNPHWIMKDPELGDHPINNGVEPSTIDDEWYYHMRFRERMEGITPILSAHPPKETLKRGGMFGGNPHVRAAVLERGEIQHLAWA